MPLGQRHKSWTPQTSQSCYPSPKTIGQAWFRHQMVKGHPYTLRDRPFYRRQGLHFLPEPHRIAECVGRNITEPLMMFGQHERPASRPQPFRVASQDCVVRIPGFDGEMLSFNSELGTDGQSHQIVAVWKWVGIVKIID